MAYADLQAQVAAWTEQQIRERRPLQAIVDELREKATEALNNQPDLAEAWRAYAHGKGPKPKIDRTGEAYSWGADRINAILVERNLRGRQLEKAGRLEEAIALYQRNLADQVDATLPYDRLRIIYTRRKDYAAAMEVCQAYLSLPDRQHGQNKEHFRHHLEQLAAKAARD